MKRFLAIPLLCILGLTGCPQSQTQKLAVASDTVAHSLVDAEQAIDLAVSSGVMPSAQGQLIETDIAKVAIAGQTLDAALLANQNASVSVQMNTFLNAFNTLLNEDVTGIKDQKLKLAVSTILSGAQTAIAVIAAGGK